MTRVIVVGLALLLLASSGCKKPPAEEPWKGIQGTWAFLERNAKGKVLSAAELKKMELIVTKDKLEVMQNGTVKAEYHLNIDPNKNPAEIDLMITEGDDQGRAEKGIYALDGNTLKLCTAELGRERPTEFAVKAKSGWTYSVLQRK